MADTLLVVLALINQEGKTLLGVRSQSAHAGGLFEFIGGKVEAGETPRAALERECKEELGAQALGLKSAFNLSFDYPDRRVVLRGFWVDKILGVPKPLGTQSLHWVDLSELDQQPMPAANDPIKKLTQLPKTYVITPEVAQPALSSLSFTEADRPQISSSSEDQWLSARARLTPNSLVYVRLKNLSDDGYIKLFTRLSQLRPDLKLVCEYRAYPSLAHLSFAVQLTAADLMKVAELPKLTKPNLLWFASVHSEEQIAQANQLGVHAVTLSPVRETTSHSDAAPLGWQQASTLAELCRCTVYALGGLRPSDLKHCADTNIYGVSGISHFN